MSYEFLLTLSIILLSTKAFGLLTDTLQMPQVVGALIAGLVMGPACLGVLQPSEFLSILAELGVVVIMFSAGTGTSLTELRSTGKTGLLVAMAGVLVPLAAGTGLVLWLAPEQGLMGAVFMGTVLTATSVTITVEALREMGKLSTKVGNTVLAAALIDDVLGLVCLTLVTSLADTSVSVPMVLLKICLFFVFAVVVGVIASRFFTWYDGFVKNHKDLHRFPVLAFALCLFMAWAAEELFGVADIIGAFAAGLMISTTPKNTYISGKFSPLSYMLLSPIFFANIGLKISLPQLDMRMVLFTVGLIAVGMLSKLIGCGMGAKICGFETRQCVQIGLGMVCRGEVALIVAEKGMAVGAIDSLYFGPIVILVVCCAVFTPVLLKLAFKGEDKYHGLQENRLAEHFDLLAQLDMVTHRLLHHEQQVRKRQK